MGTAAPWPFIPSPDSAAPRKMREGLGRSSLDYPPARRRRGVCVCVCRRGVCVCVGGVCVSVCVASEGGVCVRAEPNTLPGILVEDHLVLSAEDTKS